MFKKINPLIKKSTEQEKFLKIPQNYFYSLTFSKFQFSKIGLLSTAIAVIAQGVTPSPSNAFEIIPIEAVSTSLISHEYGGVGNSYDTFQINVSNYPGLNSMAQLVGFTLSLSPPSGGRPPAPPNPIIRSTQTPLGWQLSEQSRIPSYFYDGRPISIPTLTFQLINPDAGIFPGMSLAGFSLSYSNGCGVYCGQGPSQLAVISVSSVPEPLTILGSAIALGFGMILKRQLCSPSQNPNEKKLSHKS